MNLDEAQRQKVAAWVKDGLKLSDIQKRISTELGLTLTYMEVRFLVDDLKLTPKDVEPVKTPELSAAAPSSGGGSAKPTTAAREPEPGPAPAPRPGGVTVKVDQVTRAGAIVSGTVTFSDGNAAEWYLDQMGRLGLIPKQQGYRPSQTDVMAFQSELQTELARLGL